MNHLRIGALLLFILAIAYGCSSSTSLSFKHDYDKNAPFESYRTYKLVKPTKEIFDEMDIVHPEFLPALEEKIVEQMEAKGYKASDDPDIQVTYFVTGEDWQQAQSNTVSVGVGFGGPYGGVGMSTGNTNINYIDYRRGTLIIDMYNTENLLVWHGAAEGSYRPDRVDPNALLDYAVKSIFKRYKYKIKS